MAFFGIFAIQPSDFVKLLVILVLAKYFTRRHVEIAHIKHIIISGLYAIIPIVLVLLQPDFGSAVIIGAIWLGMIMVSGISKAFSFLGISCAVFFNTLDRHFAPYQKIVLKIS